MTNSELNGEIAVRLFGWTRFEIPGRTMYRHTFRDSPIDSFLNDRGRPSSPGTIVTEEVQLPASTGYRTPRGEACTPPDACGDWREMRDILATLVGLGIEFKINHYGHEMLYEVHLDTTALDSRRFGIWKVTPRIDEVPALLCLCVVELLTEMEK